VGKKILLDMAQMEREDGFVSSFHKVLLENESGGTKKMEEMLPKLPGS